MLRAINKLRRNFRDGFEGLDLSRSDPYPMKKYMMQMRRMYLAIDWGPLALMEQCVREEERAAAEYVRVAEVTSASTGLQTEAKVAECKESKCRGLTNVMSFWRTVDGWRQWHYPKDLAGAEAVTRPAASADSSINASGAKNSR